MAAVVAATTAVAAAAASMNHAQRIKNALWRDPRSHTSHVRFSMQVSFQPMTAQPMEHTQNISSLSS